MKDEGKTVVGGRWKGGMTKWRQKEGNKMNDGMY